MSIVNPNTLTTTRIPSAYISSTSINNPGGSNKILRKRSNLGVSSKIVIGPKVGFQYIKAENWRSGVTPLDNGYFNDGISPGNDPSEIPQATSRYWDSSNPTIFEWWSRYVVYCDGGNTTGPNGNDNLEVFVANDATELVSLTNKLIASAPTATDELSSLLKIADSDSIICTNTHYPNIPINDSVGLSGATYSLKLLLDFGFIPSYPRGGTYSYDMSNNSGHNMIFTSNTNIKHESESVLNLDCLGGCLRMTNITSLDYGYITSPVDLYNTNATISVWFKVRDVSSNKFIIDTSNGWTSGLGAGYQIIVTNDKVTIVVLSSSSSYTWSSAPGTISVGTWYNVTLKISTDPSQTFVDTALNSATSFGIDSNGGTFTLSGGHSTNSNDFILGVKSGTPFSNPFDSYLSVVSIYDGALSNNDMRGLWDAYTQCTPKPSISIGTGRYIHY